ncbi:hypothetical protein SAMN04515647_2699 [Cohaesibacter sp. ES.047]|uniref:hypothetical protein n=1 Tax=Cohaesibacter sp. ES.047 TaxID=1798205 RepID=UPI000BB8D38D|nr:hypothetical protein [Cohaesibacter sp. ES.047]SNY92426.1 hypothetical protein SAMN04515647_2699 [Cohaesibacter sp. ES.047]
MSEVETLRDPQALRAANINPDTLLATDYLNHFNEVLMLIEMLPAMPDCAEDVFSWQPMSYADYFEQSTFKEKTLAIELYDEVSPEVKKLFEDLIGRIDENVFGLIERISNLNGDLSGASYESLAFSASTEIRPLIDKASALVNASAGTTDWMLAIDHPTAQDEVDRLFD